MAVMWAYYDDRPAMVYHDLSLITGTLAPGASLAFTMRYTKRRECHPPLGTSEISYRIWHYPLLAPAYFQWIPYARPSRALSGDDVELPSPSVIPMPKLPPGDYGFQIRASYVCKRASEDQTIDSPIVPFAVR